MNASPHCIAEIEKDEGFVDHAYEDPRGQSDAIKARLAAEGVTDPAAIQDALSKVTYAIGFGTNESWVKPGVTCTRDQAEQWLLKKVHEIEDVVNEAVNVQVEQYQYDSLINFTYNVGTGAFLGSTLLRKLNAGDNDGAAHEFLRWVYSGGKKNPDLLARREEEESEFEGKQPDVDG